MESDVESPPNISGFMEAASEIFNDYADEMMSSMIEINGVNLFHSMCRTGETEMLRRMLLTAEKTGVPFGEMLTRTTTSGWSLFHQACANGRMDTLRFLLDMCEKKGVLRKGPSDRSGGGKHVDEIIATTTGDGYNMLHLAAINGQNESLSFLLDLSESAGTDIKCWLTKKTAGKQTVLQLLVSKGPAGTLRHITEYYLRKGVHLINTFYYRDLRGRNFLHCASINGQTDVIRYIVELSREYQAETGGKSMTEIEKLFFDYTKKLEGGTKAVQKLSRGLFFTAKRVNLKLKLTEPDFSRRNALQLAIDNKQSGSVVYLTRCFKEENLPVPNVYEMSKKARERARQMAAEEINQPDDKIEAPIDYSVTPRVAD